MNNEKVETLNVFQLLTTILALVLPIVQFFFKFTIDQGGSVFLFKDYFIVTSIIAAILSYVFIIAYSNVVYFEVPVNLRKHRKYREFLNMTNQAYYNGEQIRKYVQKNGVVERPYYIVPQNIYTPLALLLTIVFSWFLFLGLMQPVGKEVDKLTIFSQVIAYILSIALLTLTLAVFYINQNNRAKYEKAELRRFRKVLEVARDNEAIDEYPDISFIAQEPLLGNNTLLTLFRCNNVYYKIITDGDVRLLKSVERYNSIDDLYNSLTGMGV